MSDELIRRLRKAKTQLLTALDEIDIALAEAGAYDLVTWAGLAGHEQRCGRCGYWIFMNDPIAAVITDGDGTPTMYVHRKHVVRPGPTAEEEEEEVSRG